MVNIALFGGFTLCTTVIAVNATDINSQVQWLLKNSVWVGAKRDLTDWSPPRGGGAGHSLSASLGPGTKSAEDKNTMQHVKIVLVVTLVQSSFFYFMRVIATEHNQGVI